LLVQSRHHRCPQILKAQPARLLLVELTEFALYAIEQDLQKQLQLEGGNTELVPLLADVRSATRMAEIMRTWRPHTVYHAAAYKHVPLVEHNPAEGLRNNVLGTWNTAEQALAHGVSEFVLISTDKAVRPTNVMGASKRLAEMVLQAIAQQSTQGQTRFSMVRFGNVLGSSGSVVPLFRQQIQQSGPITLTDARITRYFMTIPEAAQLVIQAGAMASGGDVFVLDMGESVKIMDLARRMIELSGLTVQDEANPDGDIAIEVTGLRPGEKLYEELLIGDNPMPTQHPRIMKAHEEFLPWPELQAQLTELMQAVDNNNVPAMRTHIQHLVPGYHPDTEIVDWIYLAKN
jgi:FlaA1/EpsC-like NDP-sugar epimerase